MQTQACCSPANQCGANQCCRRFQACCGTTCIDQFTRLCCAGQSCDIATQTCCGGTCCTTIQTTLVLPNICIANQCCDWRAACYNNTVCCASGSRCLGGRCCPTIQQCARIDSPTALVGSCCDLGTICTGTGATRACCPIGLGTFALVCSIQQGTGTTTTICCDSRTSRCPASNERQQCIPL
jgi:hypothetical protein